MNAFQSFQSISVRTIPRARPINLKLDRFTFDKDYFTFYPLNINRPIRKLTLLNVKNLMQLNVEAFRFPSFRNLTTLHLINLPISQIDKKTFGGLSELKTLTINGTLRHYLSSSSYLAECLKLERLIIRGSGSKRLVVFRLVQPMQMLHYLSISKFNISYTLAAASFEGLMRIKVLRLCNNSIQVIEKGALDSISATLQVLDLRGNCLRQLPFDVFQRKMPQNLIIHLEDNAWDYKCHLKVMKLLNSQASVIVEVEFRKQLPEDDHQVYVANANETKLLLQNRLLRFAGDHGLDGERIMLDVSILNLITMRVLFDLPPLTECQSEGMDKEIVITKAMETFDFHEPPVDQLILNIPFFPVNMALIEIESDKHKRVARCFTPIKSSGRIERFQLKLKRLRSYQYCWCDKERHSIFPLDCIAFFTPSDADAWLKVEDRAHTITSWMLIAVFAFLSGISIAMIASVLFPQLIATEKRDST